MMSKGKYGHWIGNEKRQCSTIDSVRTEALQEIFPHLAALGDDRAVNPPAHWAYFWDITPIGDLGVDGHPRAGKFLPAFHDKKRMWASSSISVIRPITFGEEVEKHETIASVYEKIGRTAVLTFVEIDISYCSRNKVAMIERQLIVYRDIDSPNRRRTKCKYKCKATSLHDLFCTPTRWSTTLLFRFSALTHNAHRIHYDRDYTKDVEGYPGLLVQGPLQACVITDTFLGYFPRAIIKEIEFCAVRPLFDYELSYIKARKNDADQKYEVWIENESGDITMRAGLTIGSWVNSNG